MMRALPVVEKDALRLVTHQIAYDNFEDVLKLVEARAGMKVILRPPGLGGGSRPATH